MGDPRTSPPAWSQPDSIGHATVQRLLTASVIAAAPGMPRIRHAGSIGERHLAFVDSLSVAASLRATSAVAADDPRVFRGASRRGADGIGEGWPAPVPARPVVWPLARSPGAPREMQEPADVAVPGMAGPTDTSPPLSRAVVSPLAGRPGALPGSPEPADMASFGAAGSQGALPVVARAVRSTVARASGARPGTPEPAAGAPADASNPPGESPEEAMPVAKTAVLRRADPAERSGAAASTAAGGETGVGAPGMLLALAADGLRVDARSNAALPPARMLSASAATTPLAPGSLPSGTPLARAGRPDDPRAAPPDAGPQGTPDPLPAAEYAVRVMPLAAPAEQSSISLPLARASGMQSGGDAEALDGGGGSTQPGMAATLPAIARFASLDAPDEAATPSGHERAPVPGSAQPPPRAGSLSGDALPHGGVGFGPVDGLARAAAAHVELPLHVQRVDAVVQAMPISTLDPQSAAATRLDRAVPAAAAGLFPVMTRELAARQALSRRDGVPPVFAADHVAPARLEQRAESTGDGANGLPVARAAAAPHFPDRGPGGSTLARGSSAVAALATGSGGAALGLPILRAPHVESGTFRSAAATPAAAFRASADRPHPAPLAPSEPEPEALPGPAGEAVGSTAHPPAGMTAPLVLARASAAAAVPALAGMPGSLAVARPAPIAPALAMLLVAKRAAVDDAPAAGRSIARSPESAAGSSSPSSPSALPLIDPSPPTTVQHPDPAAPSPPPAAAIDVDDLVERACQAVFARLVVEQERRGYTRWA